MTHIVHRSIPSSERYLGTILSLKREELLRKLLDGVTMLPEVSIYVNHDGVLMVDSGSYLDSEIVPGDSGAIQLMIRASADIARDERVRSAIKLVHKEIPLS